MNTKPHGLRKLLKQIRGILDCVQVYTSLSVEDERRDGRSAGRETDLEAG